MGVFFSNFENDAALGDIIIRLYHKLGDGTGHNDVDDGFICPYDCPTRREILEVRKIPPLDICSTCRKQRAGILPWGP